MREVASETEVSLSLSPLGARGSRRLSIKLPRSRCDLAQNRVEFPHHLLIGEAQDDKSHGFDGSRALGVIIALIIVMDAIKLDYQMSFDTEKIDRVIQQGYLSSKLQPFELSPAQRLPESIFRLGAVDP